MARKQPLDVPNALNFDHLVHAQTDAECPLDHGHQRNVVQRVPPRNIAGRCRNTDRSFMLKDLSENRDDLRPYSIAGGDCAHHLRLH